MKTEPFFPYLIILDNEKFLWFFKDAEFRLVDVTGKLQVLQNLQDAPVLLLDLCDLLNFLFKDRVKLLVECLLDAVNGIL